MTPALTVLMKLSRTAKRNRLAILLGSLFLFGMQSPVHAADFAVTTNADDGAGSLRAAITAINNSALNASSPESHTITLNAGLGSIDLASGLPMILGTNQTINIVGNGNTIDGQDSSRLFFVADGTVEIEDLTLQNGLAQGGNGGDGNAGGGGGGGAGGGLFVNAGANVTVRNVTFSNNQAQGGTGGEGINNSASGGGGGFGGNGGEANYVGVSHGGGGGGGWGGDGGSVTTPPAGEVRVGGGGGGGLIGNGGDSSSWGGASGGGLTDGGDSSSAAATNNDGADGGVGVGGQGSPWQSGGVDVSAGDGGLYGGGGGAGGMRIDDAEQGRARAGDGGHFGGGGGSGAYDDVTGFGGDAGHGGDFGGGGGAGTVGTRGNPEAVALGGNGGFMGGGGGGSYAAPASSGGFGGGNGGISSVFGIDDDFNLRSSGDGGDGLGGAIFVRQGGSLTIIDSQISGNVVTAGQGGAAGSRTVAGASGTAAGAGMYLHTGVIANFSVATGQSVTVGDDIAGSGAIFKHGEGTLTLGGNSTNTQSGQVNAGTLIVNGTMAADLSVGSAGTLGGNGTLGNVTVHGRLNPGNSIDTQNFSSLNLATGSTTTIELKKSASPVAGTDNDQIVVTNTATIAAGTTLHFTAENAAENNAQDFTNQATYTFMQADTITGTFTNVTDDLAFFNVLLDYETNAIGDDFARLTLQSLRADFTTFASTSNQSGLATSLTHSIDRGGADWTAFGISTSMLTNSQATSLLNQVGGDSFASNSSVQVQSGSLVVGTVAGQIRGAMSGGSFGGSSSMGGSLVAASPVQSRVADSAISLVSYIDNGGGDFSRPVTADSYRPTQRRRVSPWSGWVLGYGLGGSADTDGNASGLHFGLGGMTAGISRRMDANHQIGFFGGYVGSNTTGQDADFSIQTDSGQFGAYLTGQDSAGYYLMLGGFQFDGYDSMRNIAAGAITETAAADYDGWQAFTYGERGWNFQTSDRTTFQPYAGLQYIHVSQDAFTETGAGVLNLAVEDVDADSLRSVLGARLMTSLGDHGWRQHVTPQAHVGWMHEFLDTSTVVGAQFAGVGGSGFVSEGLDLGRDFVIAGGGVNLQLTESLASSINYNTQVNEYQDLHVGSLLMTYQW